MSDLVDLGDENFLALDYTIDAMSVAVFSKGELKAYYKAEKGYYTSGISFLALINNALAQAAMAKESLSCLVTTIGPGSFSAIRVLLASVHGLTQGLQLKVCGFNSLLILAAAQETDNTRIIPIIKAYQNEIYTGGFIFNRGRPFVEFNSVALALEDLADRLKPGDLLCGQQDLLANWIKCRDYRLGIPLTKINLAVSLGRLAINLSPLTVSNDILEPLYLKIPAAEINFSKINQLKKQKWNHQNN